MRTYEHALEGSVEHKLDPKCRVSVPAEWRVSAGIGVLRLLEAKKYGVSTIKVLTEEEFGAMMERVESRDELDPGQKQMIKDRLFSDCRKTKINPQGKLLVPKTLCEANGLEPEGQVSMVGRGTYFELMKPEDYVKMRVAEKKETELLAAKLGIF